jgi:DNA-binding response OmpR family regulator
MAAPASDNRQPTVLIVEDDDATRDAMARLLAREGYLVLTAATGHDAVGLLDSAAAPVDVLLLDVRLPDVNGTELCARLREAYPDLPVVICTGEADPQEGAQLLGLGVRRYFRKPIGTDELLATVEASLR